MNVMNIKKGIFTILYSHDVAKLDYHLRSTRISTHYKIHSFALTHFLDCKRTQFIFYKL